MNLVTSLLQGGSVDVQIALDRTHVRPGETVNGYVELTAPADFSCSEVSVTFRGIARSSVLYTERKQQYDGGISNQAGSPPTPHSLPAPLLDSGTPGRGNGSSDDACGPAWTHTPAKSTPSFSIPDDSFSIPSRLSQTLRCCNYLSVPMNTAPMQARLSSAALTSPSAPDSTRDCTTTTVQTRCKALQPASGCLLRAVMSAAYICHLRGSHPARCLQDYTSSTFSCLSLPESRHLCPSCEAQGAWQASHTLSQSRSSSLIYAFVPLSFS